MTTQLPDMVRAMLDPGIYPEKTGKVELAQTQMSFVFLTDSYVYKVKKAVDLGYLDYTTLDKRRYFCQQEVELNRRLCPEVYLGVVPITKTGDVYTLGGRGAVADYAVKMRRLPADRMMNVLLERDGVSPDMAKRVAEKLAEFHRRAKTDATISAYGEINAIKVNSDENFNQTERYISRVFSQRQFQRIKEYTESTLKGNARLFDERVAGGRIRDCHGDLHAAHICFTDSLCIFDCIEFNDRFRYCDVASEIAFLAMDLDRYGRADLSRVFVSAYVATSGDAAIKELLNFYRCYRAYVRAKVGCFKLDDPYISEPERTQTLEATRGYFDLAEAYTRTGPLLLITVGLVGTGKTTLAKAVAQRLGAAVISSDIARKQLASIPATQRRFEEMDTGIYSPDFTKMTYNSMLSEAKVILGERSPVILDASFIKADDRAKAIKVAQDTGADFFILECVLDEEEIKRRLAERMTRLTASDGRLEILEPQKRRFEPVKEVPPATHIIIDTSEPLEKQVSTVMERFRRIE